MGRPKGYNFKFIKYLRMNEEQNKNWNRNTPKLIRDLLDGKFELDTQILMKMLPEFMKSGIELDLEDNEIERVRELYDKI